MNLVWTSHGEQLRGDLDRIVSHLTGVENAAQRVARTGSRLGWWGQELKAIGTTIRYAFAGSIVYGLVTATDSLAQFNNRLGEVDGLAAKVVGGNLVGLGKELNDVGDFALQTSNKFGLAADGISQFITKFFSSNLPGGIAQMRGFVEEMARMQLVLGGEVGDPQALAGGVAGMLHATGTQANPTKGARRMGNIFAELTRLSPGLTGVDITRDIGRLSGAATAMRMTPEEIFAVYGTASMAGGSTPVIGRGVAQLLTSSLLNPKSKDQRAAFLQMGLPTDPNALRAKGGWNVLQQMMRATGGSSITSAQRQSLLNIEDPAEALSQAGISGPNVSLLTKAVGRIESVRQLLNISAVGGTEALDKFRESLLTATRENRAAQREKLIQDRRALTLAANAQKNLQLQVVRSIEPLLNPVARGLKRISDWSVGQDPKATGAVIAGGISAQVASKVFLGMGLGGLAAGGLSRIPGVGRVLGRFGGAFPGAGGAIANAPQMAAAALVGSGLGAFSSKATGQRSDPLWVVVDPLSWFMPGAPKGGMGPGGDGGIPTAAGRRLPTWARYGLPIGATAALASTPLIADQIQQKIVNDAIKHGDARSVPSGHPLLAKFAGRSRGTGLSFSHGRSDDEQRIIRDFSRGYINADVAERRLRRLGEGGDRAARGSGVGAIAKITGEAQGTFMLEATPELSAALRIVNKETKVPVKLWGVSGGKPATFRGKQKTQRRSGR
jgi:hypothetical protein